MKVTQSILYNLPLTQDEANALHSLLGKQNDSHSDATFHCLDDVYGRLEETGTVGGGPVDIQLTPAGAFTIHEKHT